MCPTATAAWFTLRGPPSKCTAHRSIPPGKPGGLQGPRCRCHMLPQCHLPLQHTHNAKITRYILQVFLSSLNASYKGYLNVSSFSWKHSSWEGDTGQGSGEQAEMPLHTNPLRVAAQAAPAKHLRRGHAHVVYMSQPFVCMNENTQPEPMVKVKRTDPEGRVCSLDQF